MTSRTLPDPQSQPPAEESEAQSVPSDAGTADPPAAASPSLRSAAARSTPDEPVTSPDQLKPRNRRVAYSYALAGAALILLLLLADHPNGVEIAWAAGCAAAVVIAVVVDWQLRRNGLRS